MAIHCALRSVSSVNKSSHACNFHRFIERVDLNASVAESEFCYFLDFRN